MRHTLAALCVLGLAWTPVLPGQDLADQPTAGAAPAPAAQPSLNAAAELAWALDCPEADAAADSRCQLTQSIYEGDDDAPSARLLIGYPRAAPQPVMRVHVPTGVLIQPGLRLQVGDATPVHMPLLVCTREHCVSEMVMPEALLQAMQQAEAGSLTMLVLPEADELTLEFSLEGFAGGLAALEPEAVAPDPTPIERQALEGEASETDAP